MFRNALIFCAVSFVLIGCGTNYSGSGGGNGSGGGGTNTAAKPPQGIYLGTLSGGYVFSMVVLPNGEFYGVYGTTIGNALSLFGLVVGPATSFSGPPYTPTSTTYTANVTDYSYTGAANSGSITASGGIDVPLSGTLTQNGTASAFTGTDVPDPDPFDYGDWLDAGPASLSAISGTWTGTLLDGVTSTVTISSTGSITGSSSGCPFTGTVAPDSSNLNFFDASLTFGGSPCAFPNQTATGIGVDYLLPDGMTQQLLVAVVAGPSTGTVFASSSRNR